MVTILSEQTVLQNTSVDFKTALLAMPNVGNDTDFEREQDYFLFPNSVWEPIPGRGASSHTTQSVVEGIPKQSSRLKFFL
ncbi:hypothetical protein QUF54_07980 [Candidatus Marithioploca araucensis]|uniref:Uncharacterized protein n=1 Tax=Candidatus Marithioploca araucensis TaxID=70273 RepID=A0ABT7VUM5_9GAMM|nr:hypothetical protein [Candidatus Marithioploca araucensis]